MEHAMMTMTLERLSQGLVKVYGRGWSIVLFVDSPCYRWQCVPAGLLKGDVPLRVTLNGVEYVTEALDVPRPFQVIRGLWKVCYLWTKAFATSPIRVATSDGKPFRLGVLATRLAAKSCWSLLRHDVPVGASVRWLPLGYRLDVLYGDYDGDMVLIPLELEPVLQGVDGDHLGDIFSKYRSIAETMEFPEVGVLGMLIGATVTAGL